MTMKVWTLSISPPADGSVHEVSVVNPETVPIYIWKISSQREGNCACGQASNGWVCLPDSGDILITTHFNELGNVATCKQFDYAKPFEIGVGEHVELGIFGTGNGGNMDFSALVFYTLAP